MRTLIMLAALIAGPAAAQTTAPSVQFPAGFAPGQAPCVRQANGACVPVSADVPLPTAATVADANLVAVPAASASGTPLPGRPAAARQAALYLGTSDSVTFTIATARPGGPPAATFTPG